MKFMVTDPVIMAKAAKAQRKKQAAASKKTATAKKRKAKDPEDDHEDAPEDLSDKENRRKKSKGAVDKGAAPCAKILFSSLAKIH
jgi:hypothetical protein